MKKLGAILILISLVVTGGLLVSSATETLEIPVASADVSDALPKALEREGVWFQRVNEQTFRIKNSDREKLLHVAKVEAEKLLPTGRAFSPTDEFWRRVKPRLDRAEISYEVKIVDGDKWVVLSPKYAGRIEEVLFEQ